MRNHIKGLLLIATSGLALFIWVEVPVNADAKIITGSGTSAADAKIVTDPTGVVMSHTEVLPASGIYDVKYEWKIANSVYVAKGDKMFFYVPLNVRVDRTRSFGMASYNGTAKVGSVMVTMDSHVGVATFNSYFSTHRYDKEGWISFETRGSGEGGDEEDPGTEEPGVEEPGVEEPGTEEPGVEEPGVEEPGIEEPGVEEPGVEEPGIEEPGTEEPGTEEPGTEEPGTEEPGIEEPGTEEPGEEIPGVEEPGHPGTEVPEPEHPWVEIPGTEHPGEEAPGEETPEVTVPGGEEPGATEPEHPTTTPQKPSVHRPTTTGTQTGGQGATVPATSASASSPTTKKATLPQTGDRRSIGAEVAGLLLLLTSLTVAGIAGVRSKKS
ncbi:hypothetical protein [Levilactobacillus humaensis]|uniref:hypothetical protein n=1 Tax=Levilactobacillus humaensis TaxID=2950375 RepID=UPI0021C2AF4E|nr:hypothetical protein [Levilactobacillus humaensis]